jgi:hypothetical protein
MTITRYVRYLLKLDYSNLEQGSIRYIPDIHAAYT